MLFQYASLTAGAIRLVRFHQSSTSGGVHLVLEHQDRYFDGITPYSVLAYHQNDASDLKPITLQGRTKLVPSTLREALDAMYAYHNTSGRFWIDFVSINMKDDEEKNSHFAQLSRIYAAADKVLAWIGPADGSTEKQFAKCKDQQPENEDSKAALEALRSKDSVKDLLNQPAMESAKKIVLVCGKSECDVGRLHLDNQGHIRQSL
jgi:hypothetical protein